MAATKELEIALRAQAEELSRGKNIFPPGFYSALSHFLAADEAGGRHAWIIDSAEGAPPARQKVTCLMNDLALHTMYDAIYERALDTEAEATHFYVDQLACRACQLTRVKKREQAELAVAVHVGGERRELEQQEQSVRETLESSYGQSLRLIGREMRGKRSLLSSVEYQAQLARVAHHADMILASVYNMDL